MSHRRAGLEGSNGMRIACSRLSGRFDVDRRLLSTFEKCSVSGSRSKAISPQGDDAEYVTYQTVIR